MLSENEISVLRNADICCVDIETKDPKLVTHGPGTHRGDGHICGVGFGAAEGNSEVSAYLPLRHPDVTDEERERNEKIIADLLVAPSAKVGANIIYDLEWLEHEGYKVNYDTVHDVQYAEPLLDEYARSYALKRLAKKYSKEEKRTDVLETYNEAMGWDGKAIANLWRMPVKVVTDYVIGDVTLPLEIFAKQKAQLERENLWEVYQMETQLTPLLLMMRKNGVRLDIPLLHKTALNFAEKRYVLEGRISEWCGSDINIGSSKQLAKVFDSKGIEYPRRPPTPLMKKKGLPGNPLLDKMALTAIAKSHPELLDILEWRHYNTIESMFMMPYLDFQVDGRLHGTFHPLRSDDYGTVAGRFSASKPNLQQVSAIDEDEDEDEQLKGKVLRALFIPEEGMSWAKLDYSQIEYRILMHYAQGVEADRLRRQYNEDPTTDRHKVVQNDTGFDRRTAKRLNFGGLYGMGAATAAELFGWTIEEATHYMNTYHNTSPYIKTLRSQVSAAASRKGYIYTLLGRKARTHHSRKLHAMTNRLIQGGAADVMKKAMVDAYASGVFEELIPHLTVHDELDVSYKDDSAGNEALRSLTKTMEEAVKIAVPLLVDCHTGRNWAEAD